MKPLTGLNIALLAFATGLAAVPQPGTAAETRLKSAEIKTLLTGNTAEGKYIKWKTTHKMFFDASGKIRRTDSRNNNEKGSWSVNDQDELCINVRKRRCNEVMKRDDGGYNVYRNKRLLFTFDKILPGNPYKL